MLVKYFLSAALLLAIACHAADRLEPTQGFKSEYRGLAQKRFDEVKSGKKKVGQGEIYLVVFNPKNHQIPEDIEREIIRGEVRVIGLHVKGDRENGVFSYHFDSTRSIQKKVSELREELPLLRDKVADSSQNKRAQSLSASELKICGIELDGKPRDVEAFAKLFGANVYYIEVISKKMRPFPQCE